MPARYRKIRKIADGGMAEIFLAIQHGAEGFERRVVLKQILAPLLADPKFKNMIIDEAHVAMSLNHSNIVQVLDLGQWKGRYFLVLELVDGWDLNQLLARVRQAKFPLPPEVSLYIVAEICRALNYAHAQTRAGKPLNIVHRDVSPHNVLVSEQGEVKLTDFGIAKAATGRREHTASGIIKGKLAFMSPEQASGADLDARSDLFSAGTMLYLFFTGRRPFESPTDLETVLRVQQCQFPPALEVKPDLPPAVVKIIDRSMRKDPGERYQTGEEMLLDLEAAQRTVYKPAGQTELRRWLLDLGKQDHASPVSRMELPPREPSEMELDLEEDIVFEQSMGADTLPPLPPGRVSGPAAGGSASAVIRAADSLRAGGLAMGEAETQAQQPAQAAMFSGPVGGSGSAVLGAPSPGGRRRWLVAGVVTGAAAASGVLGVISMREKRIEADRLAPPLPAHPGTPTPPASDPAAAVPAPAIESAPGTAASDPAAPGTGAGEDPKGPVVAEAPSPTEEPAAAAAPDKPSAPVAADGSASTVAGRDAAAEASATASEEQEDDEEDEEALLKRQEPDIADKVIGADAGPAVVALPPPAAPTRTSPPTKATPSKATPASTPAPPPRRVASAPSPKPSPREPASVRIESAPTGAVVKLGSRVLGRAPMGLRFNPGITYELTFVKSGYQTTRKRFTASGRKGQRVAARLKKRPSSGKRKNFFQRLLRL